MCARVCVHLPCACAQAQGTGPKFPPPQDLGQVFKDADEDDGGAIDLREFTNLYARVKRGEVKGMGGHLVTFKPLLSDMPRAKAWSRQTQKGFKSAVARKLEVPENLVKLTFTRLVYGVLTPDDMNRVRHAFEMADADGGGNIDMAEFTNLMHKLTEEDGQPCPSDKDLRTAFDDADEDGGGAVDLDEFTKLYVGGDWMVERGKGGEGRGGGGGGGLAQPRTDGRPCTGGCCRDHRRALTTSASRPLHSKVR